MIKYIGSKRVLVDRIVEIVGRVPDVGTVCDIFTGTTRVAQGLKRAGLNVVANDLASYSEVLSDCYVATDGDLVDRERLAAKLLALDGLPGREGYFTRTFCRRARYFRPENGERIDAIRAAIDEVADDASERSILLTSLMEAADRVDSTTGLQMAYLKQWAPRAYNRMELRLPELISGGGETRREDANCLARELDGVDLVYVDPPYNQHSYFSNYHIWETLIRNDEPEAYGIAMKRMDCKVTKSDFNSRRRAWDAFTDLIGALDVPYLLVSFSNEGFFEIDDIIELLSTKGEVGAVPVGFRRYVGAQIGIHSPGGVRVGKVSHLQNKEFLFLVGPDAGRIIGSPAEVMATGGRQGAPVYSQST